MSFEHRRDEESGFELIANRDTFILDNRTPNRRVDFRAQVNDVGGGGLPPGFVLLQTGPIVGTGSSIEPRRVEIIPQNIAELRDRVTGHLQDVADAVAVGDRASQTSSDVSGALQVIDFVTPFNIPNLPGLVGGGGGLGISGAIPNDLTSVNSMSVDDTPFEGDVTVRFPAVRIPEAPGSRFDVNDLPNLEFQMELILSGTSDYPTTTVGIPPDVIFETVDILDVRDCDDLYSDIRSDVESLRSRVPSGPVTQADLADIGDIRLGSIGERVPAQAAKDRLEDMVDDIPLSPCQSDLRDILDDIDIQSCAEVTDFYSGVSSRIDSFENEVESVRDRVQQLGQGDNVDTVRERIRGLQAEDVRSGISAEGVRNEINQLRDEVSADERPCLDVLESRLQQVESRIPEDIEDVPEAPTPELPDLDCSNISSLNNRVRSFEEDVRQRTGPGAVIQPDRARSLIQEAESLMNDVEGVSDRNPCKADLRNSVNTAIQDVRDAEPETCTEIYPELENRVDELEARAVSFGAGVSEAEIQQTNDLANEIADRIDDEISSEDQECIDQFTERVQSSITRLGEEVNTIRVIQAIGEEARQRQQEQVDELEQNLAEIRERVGGIDVGR